MKKDIRKDIQTFKYSNEDYCKPIKQKIRLMPAIFRALVIVTNIYQLNYQYNMLTLKVNKITPINKYNKRMLNFYSAKTYGASKR